MSIAHISGIILGTILNYLQFPKFACSISSGPLCTRYYSASPLLSYQVTRFFKFSLDIISTTKLSLTTQEGVRYPSCSATIPPCLFFILIDHTCLLTFMPPSTITAPVIKIKRIQVILHFCE